MSDKEFSYKEFSRIITDPAYTVYNYKDYDASGMLRKMKENNVKLGAVYTKKWFDSAYAYIKYTFDNF